MRSGCEQSKCCYSAILFFMLFFSSCFLLKLSLLYIVLNLFPSREKIKANAKILYLFPTSPPASSFVVLLQ